MRPRLHLRGRDECAHPVFEVQRPFAVDVSLAEVDPRCRALLSREPLLIGHALAIRRALLLGHAPVFGDMLLFRRQALLLHDDLYVGVLTGRKRRVVMSSMRAPAD